MKELQHLFEQTTKTANDVELQLIKDFLQGIKNKQDDIAPTYINAALQMETTYEGDTCKITMPVTPLIHNSFDMPHGGILATLLDNAMGFLVNKDLRPLGKGAVTTNMTIHYVRATQEKTLVATSSYLHKGRQTLVLESKVTQPDGKTVAYATGSFFVITPPSSSEK